MYKYSINLKREKGDFYLTSAEDICQERSFNLAILVGLVSTRFCFGFFRELRSSPSLSLSLDTGIPLRNYYSRFNRNTISLQPSRIFLVNIKFFLNIFKRVKIESSLSSIERSFDLFIWLQLSRPSLGMRMVGIEMGPFSCV